NGVSALDHSLTTDEAPKVLTMAPAGDFVFATSAKIHRSALSPWAGGDAVDKTMWGNAKYARTDTVTLSEKRRRKQNPPAGLTPDDPRDTYKIAFILIARQRQDITPTAIQNLDIIRRYWDAAFNVVTLGRRNSSSDLQ